MKYGLVVYKNTENIGDDIQSYAAMKLLPRVDYYIEREELDLFTPDKKESVNVIMNGWFMHNKDAFPPSPYINPLFISTHFSSYKTYGIENEYIENNIDYLKKYAPIGCRDIHTQELLKKYKINNYYSGCVTLTLKPYGVNKKNDQICCVDVSNEVVEHIKKNKKYSVKKMTHTLNLKKNQKLSWKERFHNVEKLLKEYECSKLVITSRLHCALPCLALGVPVILLKKGNENYYNDRIDTYYEYVNHYDEKEFLSSPLDKFIDIKNSNKYLEIQNSLENTIKSKIKTKNTNELPNIDDYINLYVNKKKKLNILFNNLYKAYNKLYKDNFELGCAVEYWKDQYYIATGQKRK